MDYRKSAKVRIICTVIALILVIAGGIPVVLEGKGIDEGITPGFILLTVGVAIAVIGIIQAGIFMRCPDCGGTLYTRGSPKPQFCPQCGKPLEW